jgi:hypothetical protein
MRRYYSPGLVLVLTLVLPVVGQPPSDAPKTPAIRIPVPSTPAPADRTLKYQLLPDSLDLTPGNAAPQWLRTGQAASRSDHKLGGKESAWSNSDLPLRDLPRQEVRQFLEHYKAVLRMADRAARYERCDWELPPLTVRNASDLPLDDMSSFRQIATLLSIRCRLELSEGKFEQAASTLQTGFALARHIGEGTTLIQQLVGAAVANIMLGRVEEWAQLPGSPNLYWALTTLPDPFIDTRKGARYETGTIYRSFPQLRELTKEPLGVEQVDRLVRDLFACLNDCDSKQDIWQTKLSLAVLTAKVYPEAKQYLLEQGKTPEQVEALPTQQVVLAYQLHEYDRVRDDLLKWLAVPYWQGREGLAQVERDARSDGGNWVLRLFFPGVLKVHETGVRTDRQIAILRCVEAVRLHAALNQGKMPVRLADVRAVPLPLDVLTGRGFDALYKADGDKAVLDVPAMPGQPNSTSRRYELQGKRSPGD